MERESKNIGTRDRFSATPMMNAEVAEMVTKALTSELDPNDAGNAGAVLQEAREGNAAAQYVVGLALESLEPPLMEDALEWYRLAAAKGYTPAAEKLRFFHR